MNLERDIKTAICELALVKPEDVRTEDRLREDLGLDSVSSMELLSILAEKYDVDIEMEEAVAISTVAEVIAIAEERLSEPAQ